MSKAIEIYKKYGEKIKVDYSAGKTVDELRDETMYDDTYTGCAYNTMMVVLGMLGFPTTDYFKPQIQAKLDYLEAYQARRTLVDEEL